MRGLSNIRLWRNRDEKDTYPLRARLPGNIADDANAGPGPRRVSPDSVAHSAYASRHASADPDPGTDSDARPVPDPFAQPAPDAYGDADGDPDGGPHGPDGGG